jgi:hypothetical protein|tara:strand:+ start:108 stop:704 length:597 start_codon:yes stop_codon:yes gene_type:complete
MKDIINNSGQLDNFVKWTDLEKWIAMFKKIAYNLTAPNGADVYNITSDQIGWRWLERTVFSQIKPLFGDDIGLIFAQYQSSEHPIKIHNDYDVKLPAGITGEPWVSMLIPISVDHDTSLVENASTIILESGTDEDLWKRHLSHCDPKDVAPYKIKHRYTWKVGSLVWWHTPLQHCSNNYLETNKSKESIVIHTHKPKG